DEVDLGADDVDGRHVQATAVPDDVVRPGAAQHADTGFDGGAFAHEIEDGFGAVAGGEVEDLLRFGAVGDDGRVRADLLGQIQRIRGTVDDDDARGRHRLQDLDADVPEPAGADHHGGVAGTQDRGGLARGVV